MTKVDLSTTVAGVRLSSCLYNASGPRSGTSTALQKVAASRSGAVLTKSATLKSQTGNPQPRTWHSPDDMASLNSEGLPNNGIDYYISEETYTESMEGVDESKPYIVSLSGKTLADNLEMLDRIAKSSTKIAAIELNLACPNVIGKPIIAYDFDQMKEILKAIEKVADKLPPLGVKLPPYFDFMHFSMACDVLNQFKKTVKYVCSINTLGNATSIDIHSEAPHISSNAGFAGLSGPAVRFTALANVRKLRSLLDDEIDVVGVGGISTGQDVFEFLLAGAAACQIATAHWKEGPSAFQRILDELEELMLSKNYTCVADVKGKLKDWSREGAAKSREMSKKNKNASAGESKDAPTSADASFFKMLSAVLTILVLILLTDKFLQPNGADAEL